MLLKVRYLTLMLAGGLLFGLIGPPLGTVMFLTVAGIMLGQPGMVFSAFLDLGLVLYLGFLLGGPPAIATGAVAGVLRLFVRRLWVRACLAAPVGAVMTVIYPEWLYFGGRPIWAREIMLTGAMAAFCCTFLLRDDYADAALGRRSGR